MKKSFMIAALIAVIAGLWLGSALIFPASTKQELASTDSQAQEDLLQVRVREVRLQPYQNKISVTGRSVPSRSVEIRAETAGRIVEILAENGDRVKSGDVLARIDIRDRAERLAEAKERVNQRQIEYKAAKALENKGFNSTIRLAQTRADLEAAKTILKEIEIDKGNTEIKAPYDGVIAAQQIELGDFVREGDSAYRLVDLNPLEVVGFVSEYQRPGLQEGSEASIKFVSLPETTGVLSFIAPAADTDTRTFAVEVEIDNPDQIYVAGLTAQIDLPGQPIQAAKISPSILTLNDNGAVGVRIVDASGKAQFKAIEILADTPDFMWVAGLNEGDQIITVGQDFVKNGQAVKTRMADKDEAGLL